MDDHSVVRRLVEVVATFCFEKRTVEEDLTYSLTSEFLQNMQDVLFTKQIISYSKFQDFFADCFKRILLSPEMYLKHVFYACQQEALVKLHIFERFLSVFALILRISVETRGKSRMDFCKLVPDVFMVFYKKELKAPFARCGGFRRFVEFINNPKYLESKCITRNVPCDPLACVFKFSKDYRSKMNRMIREEPRLHQSFNSVVPEVDPDCRSLAEKVLEITKTKSILLPSDDGLMVNLSDSIQQKITPLDEKRILEAPKEVGVSKVAFESCPILSSNCEINVGAAVQMADDERYEEIIEAVVRHNLKSCHLKSKGRIHAKADRILENLKSKINSLIQVLDEDDKD